MEAGTDSNVVQKEVPRALNPRELLPPPAYLQKLSERREAQRMKNPVYRFVRTFFGEGF